MRVGILQLPHRFGQPAIQWELLERAMNTAPACDLVVLPELAITGYVSASLEFDLSRFAEPLSGPTLERGMALARRAQRDLLVPLVERDASGGLWNSVVWLGPNHDLVAHYRKRHPWYPETWANEHQQAAPVVTRHHTTTTIAICFDVHFLAHEWKDPAAVLLFPSAWVEEHDSRPALLSEVAQRHNAWVFNANWGPGVPAISGQGHSMIVSPEGGVRTIQPHTDWLVGETDEE